MSATRPMQRAMRIHCHDFATAEVDALRSLLNLLQGYLKCPWTVAGEESPDLVFVNLDHPATEPACDGAIRIGCAFKPRTHARGTIHRPLRASEVLAVLTEATLRIQTGEHEAVEVDSVEWCYRLHRWPLEFAHWGRDTWPVMAAITRKHCSVTEIASRTRIPHQQITDTLGLLKRMGLLDRVVERRVCARVEEQIFTGWQGLASRVGRLLGFAR